MQDMQERPDLPCSNLLHPLLRLPLQVQVQVVQRWEVVELWLHFLHFLHPWPLLRLLPSYFFFFLPGLLARYILRSLCPNYLLHQLPGGDLVLLRRQTMHDLRPRKVLRHHWRVLLRGMQCREVPPQHGGPVPAQLRIRLHPMRFGLRLRGRGIVVRGLPGREEVQELSLLR